jgi:hypothetical membrane protein
MKSTTDLTEKTSMVSAVVMIGIVVYIFLDIVAQMLPPHYSPIHQAESDLAVGPYGYIMRINFFIRGLISLVLIWAVSKTSTKDKAKWGLGFFSVWAITSWLLAFFNTDILDDPKLYPVLHHTWHGEAHIVLAILGFIAAPIGATLVALAFLRSEEFQRSGRVSMVLAGISIIALLAMKQISRIHSAGGLGERIFLVSVLVWMFHTAFVVLNSSKRQDFVKCEK